MTSRNNPAHDLLLLLLNLAQQKSAERVRSTFIEAAGALFAPLRIRWLDPEESFGGEVVAVATLHREYGRIAVVPSDRAPVDEALPLLHNAAGMLAVILEKHENGRLLADEKLLLRDEIDARTRQLRRANEEYRRQVEELARTKAALGESEDRFKHAFENLAFGISLTLPSGEVRANRAFFNMLGYTEGSPEVKWQEITHPEDIASSQRMVDCLLSGESDTASLVKRYRHRDGSTVWADVRTTLRRDEEGRPLYFLTAANDITEHRQAELALRASEENLVQAQRLAHIGSWAWNLETDDVACSEEMLRIWGFDPHRRVISLREAFDRIHAEDREAVQAAIDRTLTDGVPYEAEFRLRLPDGRERLIHGIGEAAAGPDGKPAVFHGTSRDISEVRRAEEALRDSEERLELAIEGTNLGMWDWNVQTGEVAYSERWMGMLGYGPEDLDQAFRTWETLIHPEDKPGMVAVLKKHFADDANLYDVEFRLKSKNGEWRWIHSRGRLFARDGEGRPLRMVGTHVDITARKKAEQEKLQLESQLHQSQKMEAVGRLAGGVAHDFNNILTGILGFAELAQSAIGPGDPIHGDLDEIRKAAERAADLTAQLLAFSRKQIINPRVIRPNDVLQNSQRMLERIIGEDIDFLFRPARDLWRIRADTGQLDQVLVNLAVNARDAMPDGGKLTIETQNVTLDEAYCRIHEGAVPGDYVMLAVSDSGHGMDAETLEHIFEPFYSTKGTERGTGLGLSTVYGIMKQNRGFINVYSEPGAGTVFKICFPAVMDEPEEEFPVQLVSQATGSETILLVEDEDMVRRLATKILETHGYTVIAKENGGMALLWAEQNDDRVDLLFTDVIMPGMNGRDLLARLREDRPELRALFMSGYTENVIAHHGVLDEDTEFIQKPFTVGSLARKVRTVLDH